MKFLKRLVKRLVVLAILGGLGFAGWVMLSEPEEEIPYRMEKIVKGDIANVVVANGSISPMEILPVGAQVSGKIYKIHAKVNQKVKAGDLLAELDPALIETEIKRKAIELQTAQMSYELYGRERERTAALVEKDYLAKVDLERANQNLIQARNRYDSAKTQLEREYLNLSHTKVHSPIDGTIIVQSSQLGQNYSSSSLDGIFKIVGDMSKMKIDASLPESDISQIKVGQEVRFTVDAYADREYKGEVADVNVYPNSQQGVVIYTVTININNTDLSLLPGMTANLTFILSEVKDVLRLPAAALRFLPPKETSGGLKRLFQPIKKRAAPPAKKSKKNDKATVVRTIYLWKDNELMPVDIETGATDETYVEITAGDISEGDTVVIGIQARRN